MRKAVRERHCLAQLLSPPGYSQHTPYLKVKPFRLQSQHSANTAVVQVGQQVNTHDSLICEFIISYTDTHRTLKRIISTLTEIITYSFTHMAC